MRAHARCSARTCPLLCARIACCSAHKFPLLCARWPAALRAHIHSKSPLCQRALLFSLRALTRAMRNFLRFLWSTFFLNSARAISKFTCAVACLALRCFPPHCSTAKNRGAPGDTPGPLVGIPRGSPGLLTKRTPLVCLGYVYLGLPSSPWGNFTPGLPGAPEAATPQGLPKQLRRRPTAQVLRPGHPGLRPGPGLCALCGT